MTINPKMWHDRHFVPMSDQGKLLWCYLLTGNNDGVPGLLRGGPGTYSDAMRWPQDVTSGALDELIRATFVEYDLEVQLLRVPGRPSHVPCTNANVLKAWFRRWKDVPESPLKYRQIGSIRKAVEDRKWFQSGWDETFGTIKIPEPSKQVPLFLLTAAPVLPVEEPGSASSENGMLNPSGNPSVNPSGNDSERVCGTNTTSTYTSTSSHTSTSTSTDPDATAEERPRVADPIERGMIASELWRLQEDLRAELAPGVLPREHPASQDLRPITEALEIYTREELENSLRVNAATAANKPEKMEYFNGYSNWHPNSLRRTVGQVVPTSAGRHAVQGRTKFKGGSAL